MYGNLARKKAIKKAYVVIMLARRMPKKLYENFV